MGLEQPRERSFQVEDIAVQAPQREQRPVCRGWPRAGLALPEHSVHFPGNRDGRAAAQTGKPEVHHAGPSREQRKLQPHTVASTGQGRRPRGQRWVAESPSPPRRWGCGSRWQLTSSQTQPTTPQDGRSPPRSPRHGRRDKVLAENSLSWDSGQRPHGRVRARLQAGRVFPAAVKMPISACLGASSFVLAFTSLQ